MGKHVTNLELSSQACRMPAVELMEIALGCDAVFVPAHCFTPHKSPYGACVERMSEMFGDAWESIPAIELGLSADSYLADRIAELSEKTFLSNSDAHSLPRIGREYNILEVEAPTFDEFSKALLREEGRSVVANFGLDPRLGKYHRTFCEDCEHIAVGEPPVLECERCGSTKVTRGVLDRIVQIADYGEPHPPDHRPRFGSEMGVLHEATREELGTTVGAKIADLIIQAREGTLPLQAGGGGHYGKAAPEDTGQLGLPGVS